MTPAATLTEMLRCPRCAGTLAGADGGLLCDRCAARYPFIGGIPCLVEDPALWQTLWLRRLDDYSAGVETRVQALRQEADSDDLLPRTRERLRRIATGFEQQLEMVTALFEPLEQGSDAGAAMAVPSRAEPSVSAAVLECYEHVFRDWAWGQRECELSLELLRPVMPPALPRVAVYGAGAGRLAVDIHQSFSPGATLALDVNPLPFLIAERVLAGEQLTLPEFPVDPNSDGDVVVERKLTRPFELRPGFSFIFADALRAPLAGLDAVVTSWFIDVTRVDLRHTAAAINRVLRPGGLWLNLGPLRFHADLARSYSIEETLEIVGASAFELLSNDKHDIPYFDSPVSGSRRTDLVFRFAARKTGEAPTVVIPDSLPPWVTNPLSPIPITPALVNLGRTSMFTTGVLSLIDGNRSIVDVAQALGSAWGVEPGRLVDELRVFLGKLPAA